MVVVVHGVLTGGTLWDTVVEGLRDRYRCIVPGAAVRRAHHADADDADLSPSALATLIAEFPRRAESQPRLMRPRRPVVRLP